MVSWGVWKVETMGSACGYGRQVLDGVAAGQSASASDIAGVLAEVGPQVPTLCAAASQGGCCVGSFVEWYQKVSACACCRAGYIARWGWPGEGGGLGRYCQLRDSAH
jgi:hypothetical protein